MFSVKPGRRAFLGGVALAGASGWLTLRSSAASAAEAPPETTTIRLIRDRKFPVLCYAPQYVAEQFLEMEGFTDIQYVSLGENGSYADALISGHADISAALGVDWVMPISQNQPIKVLSGLHAGCVEIFANDQVQTIRDLKGKRVAITGLGSPERYLLASVAALIGVDPEKDIEWVFGHPNDWVGLLVEDKVDAIATFPPLNYVLHDQKIGHVILNTTTDDPWRYYFCCMVAANSDFVENHPVATKRAMRAMLKANQLCSEQPEVAAEWLVESGQSPTVDYAMRTLTDLPYDAWLDYDAEDSMRFYALRLREAGLIEATPQEVIANGTDWRFLEEIKRELKA